MPILAQLASEDVLDTAHEWLCRRRRLYSANSDVSALRRCWPREKEQIKGELLSMRRLPIRTVVGHGPKDCGM